MSGQCFFATTESGRGLATVKIGPEWSQGIGFVGFQLVIVEAVADERKRRKKIFPVFSCLTPKDQFQRRIWLRFGKCKNRS